MNNNIFPFSAIYKNENLKEAIILNLINPKIGGLIIDGDCGSGKSRIMRSVANITDLNITEIPSNISEDRLLGSVAVDKILSDGEIVFESGVLANANGGIALTDDLSFMSENIADILQTALSDKEIRIEREGVSHIDKTEFIYFATVNLSLYTVKRSLIESFGMYAKTDRLKDIEDRMEIIRINEEWDCNCNDSKKKYAITDQEVFRLISDSKERLKKISISDEIYKRISEKCIEENVRGNAVDMIMCEGVKAVAALHGREHIIEDDIEEASFFVLPHRKRMPNQSDEQTENNKNDEKREDDKENNHNNRQEQQDENIRENTREHEEKDSQNSPNIKGKSMGKAVKKTDEVGKAFNVINLSHSSDKKNRSLSGRRTESKTDKKSGRYINAIQNSDTNDIALDATIRAAAPFQKTREKNGMAISIHKSDIREKVRQKKVANLFIFVVDSSGSMGAVKRMTEAKGAALSLLKDAYVKRDKVCMVTFSGDEASVVLPPTRSVERGYKLLENIKTGGRTPLNSGIEKGLRIIQNELRQNPQIMPLLILITDGKGNVSIDKEKKADLELSELGEKINKIKCIESIVIDIENSSLMSFNLAKKLSNLINAKYYKLDEIKAGEILNIVNEIVV